MVATFPPQYMGAPIADRVRICFVDDLAYGTAPSPEKPGEASTMHHEACSAGAPLPAQTAEKKKANKLGAVRSKFRSKFSPPLPLEPSHPYKLSDHFEFLVSSPVANQDILQETLGRLQNALPQLKPEQRRQAKADIACVRSLLDGESRDMADIKASAAWGSGTSSKS